MKELTFLVRESEEGDFYAEAMGVGIFAEGDAIDDLKNSVQGGIDCYYENTDNALAFAILT